MILSHFICFYEKKQYSLTQIQHKCLEWNDHYDDDIASQKYQIFSHRITKKSTDQFTIESSTETTNTYIYHCLFSDCSSELDGGVLYFTKANGKLLIEFSIFEECHSESNGGAVYVKANCECVTSSICSYKCYAPNNEGLFIYAYVQNGKKNYVRSSSICSTYEVIGNSNPIRFSYGSTKCDYVNISNYNVSQTSAISISFASPTSQISYCYIVANHAEDCACINFGFSSITRHVVNFCNIVNNSQGNIGRLGTLHFDYHAIFQQCNIIDNEATYLFCLSHNNPTVTIDGTFIKHNTNRLQTGTGQLNNNKANEEQKIEYRYIDCMRLRQQIITFDLHYYFSFIHLFRTSLIPSIYI